MPLARVDVPAAHRAVLAVLEVADEFTAELQVVVAACVVGRRKSSRICQTFWSRCRGAFCVGVDREIRERDARIAVGHARRLPMLGPGDERVVREAVVAVAAADFVQRPVAQHLRELPDVLLIALVLVDRGRRVTRGRAVAEGILAPLARRLAHDARLRRELVVEPDSLQVPRALSRERDVECRDTASSRRWFAADRSYSKLPK